MKIEIEAFIELYNNKECELIDVRVPFETAVWKMNFGLFIPANELPDYLDTLPKDKLWLLPVLRQHGLLWRECIWQRKAFM